MGITLPVRLEATLSNKGWIGFSRTSHSDAVFSGEIASTVGPSAASLWAWAFRGTTAASGTETSGRGRTRIFMNADGSLSSLEALVYEMPLGLVFRKAVLWHGG